MITWANIRSINERLLSGATSIRFRFVGHHSSNCLSRQSVASLKAMETELVKFGHLVESGDIQCIFFDLKIYRSFEHHFSFSDQDMEFLDYFLLFLSLSSGIKKAHFLLSVGPTGAGYDTMVEKISGFLEELQPSSLHLGIHSLDGTPVGQSKLSTALSCLSGNTLTQTMELRTSNLGLQAETYIFQRVKGLSLLRTFCYMPLTGSHAGIMQDLLAESSTLRVAYVYYLKLNENDCLEGLLRAIGENKDSSLHCLDLSMCNSAPWNGLHNGLRALGTGRKLTKLSVPMVVDEPAGSASPFHKSLANNGVLTELRVEGGLGSNSRADLYEVMLSNALGRKSVLGNPANPSAVATFLSKLRNCGVRDEAVMLDIVYQNIRYNPEIFIAKVQEE